MKRTSDLRTRPAGPITALGCALTVAVTLCGAAGAQVRNPDTLSVATLGDWGSGFDPAFCYDSACGDVLENTTERLYGYSGTNASRVVPLLAGGPPVVSNGGRTYTVKLRRGAKFSDGKPVTAEDVEYSLERVLVYSTETGAAGLLLEPLLGSAAQVDKKDAGAFDRIDKAIATRGSDTVVFNLAKPFAPFPSVLAFYAFAVIQKDAAVRGGDWSGTARDWKTFNQLPAANGKWTNTGLVGTGPFTLERYEPGRTVVLRRNANYWRAPAKLGRVIIQSVNDDTTRLQMLRTGDADMISRNGLPAALLDQARQIPGVRVDTSAGLNLYGFFFTHRIDGTGTNHLGSGKLDGKGIPANFFSDVNVRKGIAAAFDYDAFIKDVMRNLASQQNTVAVKGLLGYTANGPKYKTDRAAAVEFFKKAWNGEVWESGFVLPVFYNSGNTTRQRGLEILKRNLESLNPKFRIEVRELPFSQYIALQSAQKIPLWQGGWGADYADPHNMAQPFLASTGNYPVNMAYGNAQLDKLIDDAIAETSNEKRASLYQQIARIGFEQVPLLPFYQNLDTFVSRDWVKNRLRNPIFSSDYYYPITKGP